ncbi:hypothetical protein LJC07_03935 [Christensenellaceae bacterium OttesenSCG-928-L17]|nr:hypothetical protein [Christensenellaceae bacterium OttesenSCG-928-L17]
MGEKVVQMTMIIFFAIYGVMIVRSLLHSIESNGKNKKARLSLSIASSAVSIASIVAVMYGVDSVYVALAPWVLWLIYYDVAVKDEPLTDAELKRKREQEDMQNKKTPAKEKKPLKDKRKVTAYIVSGGIIVIIVSLLFVPIIKERKEKIAAINTGKVYYTSGGTKYHIDKKCSGMINPTSASEISAQKSRERCSRCYKGVMDIASSTPSPSIPMATLPPWLRDD